MFIDDNIDCYDRGRYYPATILYKFVEEVNNLPKVEYKVGFRIYPQNLENWQTFTKYWPNVKSLGKDKNNRPYFGDEEGFDEVIPSYSKRIKR